jgi:putative ABC transport system permease protein
MLPFLRLFLRNALRSKTFTFLNILGLAVGMASFIIIMLWVSDELSYDSYNEKADRIYRVNMYTRLNGIEGTNTNCPSPLAAAVLHDYPEVENVVRFRERGGSIIRYGADSYSESRIIYADSSFFDVFTVPLLKGNRETALKVPYTVAISESMAAKYFHDEDPINKILIFNNRTDYRVTAVFRDIPEASHFHFDFIASVYSSNEYKEQIWVNSNFQTYVLFTKNADPVSFEKKLPQLIENYIAPQASEILGTTWEKLLENGLAISFSVQNVRDIHLTSGISGEFEASGDIKYVYIFTLIAIFIIILACINFTNLSTARSTSRLKEVGIRKVFGVQRGALAFQFLLESFFIVFAAHIVAMIITEVSLPFFNDLSGKNLSLNYFDYRFIGSIVGLILIISFVAGSYPALYLSSFKPISVLKGEMVSGRKKTSFRSILVIGQFTISLLLLSSTLILYRQMNYIQKKNLGYDKEQLLVIDNTYLLGRNINSFKDQILTNPQIIIATKSGFLPSPSNRNNGSVFKDGILSNDPIFFSHFSVDDDYLKTFQMKIVRGRWFSREFSTDSSAIIINEAGAKLLGWEDPIGKKIGYGMDIEAQPNKPSMALHTIIGVVADFNFASLHEPVGGLAIYLDESNSKITCRIRRETDITSLIDFIKSRWSEFAPDQPFHYYFISDNLNLQYGSEVRLGKILGIFTGLAFFVSCLGLFGLALFASENRKKEIGLRKVNGSGIFQIIWLLSADFTRLIIISLFIACPVSYFMMSRWLENFAFHTNITFLIFAIAGLASYLIAMATIGYQSYRSATANPADTLRNE